MTRRTDNNIHHTHDPRDPRDPQDSNPSQGSEQRGGDAPRGTQDTRPTWGPAYLRERAQRAWAQAHGWRSPLLPSPSQQPVNLGPDSAYTGVREPTAAEYVGAWVQREQETRTARITARLWQERIRARAEERRRAIWSAMDTGPLLLWPDARPEVLPAQGCGGGIVGEARMFLIAHPQGPELRFTRGEHVVYSRAGHPRRMGRVEGAERWSTGWRYAVRWQERRGGERGGTGIHLVWADHVEMIWQDWLTSLDARARRTKPPVRDVQRREHRQPSEPGSASKP